MYLRFVVGDETESSRTQTGLFTEIASLRNDGLLEDYQVEMVEKTFNYFNDYLPVPPYKKKGWGLNAISWFKDSAIIFIDKMWDFKSILEQNDISVRILKTEKPGMILYEDDFQIVAQSRNF